MQSKQKETVAPSFTSNEKIENIIISKRATDKSKNGIIQIKQEKSPVNIGGGSLSHPSLPSAVNYSYSCG